MTRRRPRGGFHWRSLYQWHRVIGLAAALFVLILAVTGIALNHTERLGLDRQHVSSPALLDWYGIEAPEPVSYTAAGHRITGIGERLYFDSTLLERRIGSLVGAVAVGDVIVVGVTGELLLLAGDGQLIEVLGGAEGVPAGMRAVGEGVDGRIVLRAAHGDYTTDIDDLDWHEEDELPARWAQPSAVPSNLAMVLAAHWRGEGLPLERLLLDVHTGRIVGEWGVYVMDAAAVLLILLSLSGFILWLNGKRKERLHRRKHEKVTQV